MSETSYLAKLEIQSRPREFILDIGMSGSVPLVKTPIELHRLVHYADLAPLASAVMAFHRARIGMKHIA